MEQSTRKETIRVLNEPSLSDLLVESCETQCEIVARHLIHYQTITALHGQIHYGVGNLQGRISDLRRHYGWTIETEFADEGHAIYKLVEKGEMP